MTIVAGIDIETTGLLAADHRIIEVYISLWRKDKRIFEFDQRIDPQRSISADALRVHGIDIGQLAGKPTWDAVAPNVVKVLSKADLFVWHNGDDFDGPFIEQELKRISLTLPKRQSVDTMKAGVWATPDGKKPTLAELCFSLGIDYDATKAHAASYDVGVMMEAYNTGVRWGYFQQAGIIATAA
jgi:DNA polymerase-3 subunit epsilon